MADRMPAFFAGADALLVSLRAEPIFETTIPGKVQSYLASGRPVLGMIDGEGRRVIDESGGGLTAPAGNGAALGEAVRRLAALMPAERQAMGRRGREYALREFNRNALFDQFVSWAEDARVRMRGR